MSNEITAGGKSSSLWKSSKGLLSKVFNASAEDKRIKNTLQSMNKSQLGRAIQEGMLNPKTGQVEALPERHKDFALRAYVQSSLNHLTPK